MLLGLVGPASLLLLSPNSAPWVGVDTPLTDQEQRRDVRRLSQGHSKGKRRSLRLNSGIPNSRIHTFNQ